MLRLPRSPRTRRRLAWGSAAAALVAVGIAVALLIPTHSGGNEPVAGTEGPADLAVATPQVKLSRADRQAIDRTLDIFLPQAMERRDPAAAWALAGPELRSGSTLAEWRRGTLPVPEYQARERTFHHWQTIESTRSYVIFNLLVHPAKGSKLAPYVFSGMVVKQKGRWLVNRLYTIAIMNPVTKTTHEWGPADFAAPAGGSGAGRSQTSRLGKIGWLPILGVLAAVLLIPLSLAGVALVRARRFKRHVRATRGTEMPTLPARYRQS
jgi:hypothetical protein